MSFDNIFELLKNRKTMHFPMSDREAVDIIVKANMDGDIDDEEKEMLLDLT